MKLLFTSGNWDAVGLWVEHPDFETADICNCDVTSMGQAGRSDEEQMANAQLISAAPDMFRAMIALTQSSAWDLIEEKTRLRIHAALTKAIHSGY